MVLKQSNPLPLFFVDSLLSFLVLLVKMPFCQICVLLLFVSALLVEFEELLLVIEHFLEEQVPSVASAHLTATDHLLLEVVEQVGLFLVVCLNASSPVEVAVNKLSLEQEIAHGSLVELAMDDLVGVVARQYLQSQALLDGLQLHECSLHLELLLHLVWSVICLEQLINLAQQLTVFVVCLSLLLSDTQCIELVIIRLGYEASCLIVCKAALDVLPKVIFVDDLVVLELVLVSLLRLLLYLLLLLVPDGRVGQEF